VANFIVTVDETTNNVTVATAIPSSGGPGTDTTALHDNVADEILGIAAKGSPVGADILLIEDSEAAGVKKRVSITNLPGGADADAIHGNVAAEISPITEKVTPVAADLLLIEDSAAANAKKRVQVGNLRSRVLLAEDTQTNVAKLTVSSQDWFATYDVVELELAVLALSAAALEIQPIDTLIATAADLESNVFTHTGSRFAGEDNANWRTAAAYLLGIGADDYLTGTAKFHAYNGGFLNGQAAWNYRSGAVHYNAICGLARHTNAIGRNDGFDVLMSTGNITGVARLYGLRN